MAEHESTAITTDKADLGKLGPMGAVLAVIGGLLFFVLGPGITGGMDHLYGSYMFGLLFWTLITLGCLGMGLLHHTVRGTWSVSVMRLFESGGGAASLLLMAVLFIPIIVLPGAMHSLYEWTHAEVVKNDPILTHKAPWLNETRWVACLVLYFAIWILWSTIMRRSTLKQDESKNFKLEAGRMSWGAVGMVVFAVTSTFASVDWIMSMEPHWYSTMYGLCVVINACYGALAIATVFVTSNARKEPYKSIMSHFLTRDIGNMLFVLTMLWGYTTLSQFLIIWNGNIPETTSYYQKRMAMYPDGMQGNWWAVLGFILIIGTFFVPFYCLLAPRVKKYTQNLRSIGIWMFLMCILNVYMLVIPALPGRGELGPISKFTLPDIFAWMFVGGLWLVVFGAISRRAPLVPLYDTRLQEAASNAH
ncbi:hypothetical protein BH11ARM1_BH11ARM1_09530 [soil metagenome]